MNLSELASGVSKRNTSTFTIHHGEKGVGELVEIIVFIEIMYRSQLLFSRFAKSEKLASVAPRASARVYTVGCALRHLWFTNT